MHQNYSILCKKNVFISRIYQKLGPNVGPISFCAKYVSAAFFMYAGLHDIFLHEFFPQGLIGACAIFFISAP
jgi:hypothetical protein